MNSTIKLQKTRLFPYLLLLTALFIVLEMSFFLRWVDEYLGDYKGIANQFTIPPAAVFDIVCFIFIQISIHFLYTVFIWSVTRLIGFAVVLRWKQVEKIGFSLWIVGLCTVLLANQHYFPNSIFSYVISALIPFNLGFFLLIISSIILLAGISIAFVGLFFFSRSLAGLLMLVIFTSVVYGHFSHSGAVISAKASDKPNVIIIGIDSVRPDFLGFFGENNKTIHIDQFLNQATVFADALTPLARTFPAWISILTGEYPKHHGIRTVLSDTAGFDFKRTLPMILRQHGYETVFAIDETRFSNIDQTFGFNHIIAPPIGFNDFLLGTVNDFPLSNLMINTWLGHYLFPYSDSNRGVFTAYDPDSFISKIGTSLGHIQQRPLFLAVHFCLPHYPYLWGTGRAEDKFFHNYRAALLRVDKQFNDFMKVLADNRLLDHSIVVLLSDHGEAIELPGDRVTQPDLFIKSHPNQPIPHFYPPSLDVEAVNQSGGHGSDVLSLTQYHVLLAFKLFDKDKHPAKVVSEVTSLLDIKPTLLSLLGLYDEQMDGHSLAQVIRGEQSQLAPREDFLMETDFSPVAVRSIHPNAKQVLSESMNYFQIDPKTTRVTVKKDMLKFIISSKQYADLYHGWILALYPQSSAHRIPILVNLTTGEWTNDLTLPFAKHSPAQHMLYTLKHFYGDEVTTIE